MSVKKESVWHHVMECAVTGSIDYSCVTPQITFCDSDVLEKSVTWFVSEKGKYTQEESRSIYRQYVIKALHKEPTGEKYLNLARIGLTLGQLFSIVIIITFIATFFNLVFFAFTMMAISFSKTCKEYIRIAELKKKASLIWKNALLSGSAEEISQALDQMEQIFMTGK